MKLQFCDKCGTFMKKTFDGFTCPRCGHHVEKESFDVKRPEKTAPEPIYVFDSDVSEDQTVTRACPVCDGNKAYKTILTSQGEHAGVKQDRSIERYTCVKCRHTWIEK
jgi:DNA-directed RNA polymerase subunit M/transcription elongation factor TFIIS